MSKYSFFISTYLGIFKIFEETEVHALLTTKNDEKVWNIFPNFGEKKEEEAKEGEDENNEVEK